MQEYFYMEKSFFKVSIERQDTQARAFLQCN